MNSSTTNSEPHARYAIGLLLLVLSALGALFGLGVYLQPVDGDLTRIGYFAERDYGWNGVESRFADTRLLLPRSAEDPGGRYSEYHDVLIIGDSFSYRAPKRLWVNYLIAATGWSVAIQNINVVRLQDVVQSPAFRNHPPRLVIMESAERELSHHLEENGRTCDTPQPSTTAVTRSTAYVPVAATDAPNWDVVTSGMMEQNTRSHAWQAINLGYVRRYASNNLARSMFGKPLGSVQVKLNRTAPFSSAVNDVMLIYQGDIDKIGWWRETGLGRLECWLEQLRAGVEANRFTRFVMMVAPDKLTVYGDFVGDAGLGHASLLATLAEHRPDLVPRIDLELAAAVERGELDVYLPNNSHWGAIGHRIAATSLLRFLATPPSPSGHG